MSTAIGTDALTFTLPDTDGAEHGVGGEESSAVTLVVFICNHCSYALAWHDRIVAVAEDYPDVKVLAVSSNDAERYPRDSFEAMRARVSADGGWPMAYLRDESQEVARAYDAKTTPDVFVFDSAGTLRYRGAPDSDHMDDGQNAVWLRDALRRALTEQEPA